MSEVKEPNSKADVDGPAGTLVFHVGALRWIPLEPLGRLEYATLEGSSTRSGCATQIVEWRA